MYQPAPQPIYQPPKKNNTGKIIAGVVGVLFVLALIVAAMGSNNGAPTASKPGAPAAPSESSLNTRYLEEIEHDNVPHGMFSDIFTLGHDVCKDLDAGTLVPSEVITVASLTKDGTTTAQHPLADSMFTMAQSQAIVYDAVDVYCPKYKNQIPA